MGRKKITNEEFLSRLKRHNPDIECMDTYIGAVTPIGFKCKKCGYVYYETPSNVLNTKTHSGCPECHRSGRKTHEWFLLEMNDINPNIIINGKYHTMNTNIECICKICGHMWSPIPLNLLKGRGCPICRLSHGEKRILKYLNEREIDYITQHSFDDLLGLGGGLLSYDFYLPKHNMLIEYQGEFHNHTDRLRSEDEFQKQQIHDERKRKYAQSHNIELLEIWYYDFDNIEDILTKKIQNKMIVRN